MITTPEEYQKYLFRIQDQNSPEIAILLPSEERIYNIDLNKRSVDAPEFLSVQTDHYAETIYFKMNRYFDNMDLADTVGVVQFNNSGAPKNGTDGYIYTIPFYDITTYAEEEKILFPWCISGIATQYTGIVTYAFRFYTLNGDGELVYSLNTIPSQSKVLKGLDLITPENGNINITDITETERIWSAIKNLEKWQDIYWIEA